MNPSSLVRPAAGLLGCVCVSTSTYSATNGITKPEKVSDAPVPFIFSDDRLKNRKLDPRQIELFAKAPRFLAGRHRVTLFVNGNRQGEIVAAFNHEGQLCMDERLLASAHLKPQQSRQDSTIECGSSASIDSQGFLADFPQTVIELRPGKNEVHLIVPLEALLPREVSGRQFTHGGTAALLNYDAFAVNNTFGNRSTEFQNLNTVAGLNIGEWLFRSRQTYTSSGDSSQLNHVYAYGQRTFGSLGSTFQGGQISVNNSVYSGLPLTGLQAFPEDSLRSNANVTRVEGIALSPARVEVRQNGNLVHTSMIPEGPFLLTDLELNRRVDAYVTVIESNGSRNSFIVPAASLDGSVFDSSPGYAFAVGHYRPTSSADTEQPLVLTGSGTWPLSPQTRVTAGALGSQEYQGFAWSMGVQLTPQTRIDVSQLASNSKHDRQGTSLSASLSTQLASTVNLNLSTEQQTEGYRDFQQSLERRHKVEDFLELDGRRRFERYFAPRDRYGASLGWNTPVGGFNLSTSYARSVDDQNSRSVGASWSNSYKGATINVNLQKNSGNRAYDNGLSSQVSINVPFGNGLRAFSTTNRHGTRSGATFNDTVNDNVSYQLRGDHDDHHNRTNLSASTSLLPRYTQLNLGYSQSNQNSTSYNARMSGGVVAHGSGVTLSPYAVDDTFSVISVGDLSGVKISTPRGPIWTDMFGQAIAPSLRAHNENQVSVAGETLPRNIDVVGGVKKLKPARGTVERIEFDVMSTRRTMLVVKDHKGELLPKGLAVMNEHNQYVTTTIGNGKIYFQTLEPGTQLNVYLSDGHSCQVSYAQPKQADPSKIMETLQATCLAP